MHTVGAGRAAAVLCVARRTRRARPPRQGGLGLPGRGGQMEAGGQVLRAAQQGRLAKAGLRLASCGDEPLCADLPRGMGVMEALSARMR